METTLPSATSSLDEEIRKARKNVVKDGYDMSIGELMSLYRSGELFINPRFQRLFRWEPAQKTRFIESLLLGIPIPPIFVYSTGRNWELVDGLQRISTILQFAGELLDPSDRTRKKRMEPLVLLGTDFLPSLENRRWDPTTEDSGDGLSDEQKFEFKRVRIRVEILMKESDPTAKYELFQRLNTGGSRLSEQEVRSCVIEMINEDFAKWARGLSTLGSFKNTIKMTKKAEDRQKYLEYLIRFLAFRNVSFTSSKDVHLYLDKAVLQMAKDDRFPRKREEKAFRDTCELLERALGFNAYRKWDGKEFRGPTRIAAFEFISYGVSLHINDIMKMHPPQQSAFLVARVKALWDDPDFRANVVGGVRGTTRLANLLPKATDYFRHEEAEDARGLS